MTLSDKQKPPGSTNKPQEQSSATRKVRVLSLDEARKLGIPISNDLIISPLPRTGSKGSPTK